MCSMEGCQISVPSVKSIKYHHRLFYFLTWDLGKFKEKSYILCEKDTHKVLDYFFLLLFFGTSATLKCLNDFFFFLECFYEKIKCVL